jgi:hypothetical protein
MLRAYFDDSGTHSNSDVAVMGGLAGTVAQWEQFEAQWAAKLKNPQPGKPPLRMFHLSACNARDGEFESYNRAEQDLLIRELRQIIIDAGLLSVAMAVDKKAWDELIFGPLRDVLGDALSPCFENCISEIVRFATPHPEGDKIAVVFDKGIETERFRRIAEMFTLPPGRPRIVSVNFLRVEDALPLQGADIVATENYWHAAQWLKLGDAALPRPHLRHFLDNIFGEGLILDREAIASEVARRGPDGRLLKERPF